MRHLKYLAFLAFYVSLLIPRFLQGQSGALGNGYNAGSILPALTYNGYLPQAYAPASFTLYGYDATGLTPGSALYVSGITATGAANTYCDVTVGGGAPSATGRLYLTALNIVAASSAINFAAVGSQVGAGYASAPTSATASNGTATCSGTIVITSTLGAYAAFAVDGAGNIQAGSVNQGATTPAACVAGQIFTTVIAGSAVPYYCSAVNTWTILGGGSGTFVALNGDAASTTNGGATTVKGINGTLLSGLATGVLKNTTTTGVPSIASYADIVALWSSCSGIQYLGYDGTCHTPAGAVASVANVDGTLTISPTTGSVVASLALGHANTWSATQTFVAPALGTPVSGVATNLTGTAAGLTSGSATNIAGGAANEIHYQTGTGVTGFITAAASCIILTNGSNVPSCATTLPSGLTIPGYLTSALAASTYAPLASPTFTGTPTVPGYLTSAVAASTYAPIFTVTTTGSSGAATYISNVLNIPQYSGGGTPGGTNGQAQYNNGGSFGGFTFSGDFTLTPSTGVGIVGGLNGVPFCAGFTPTNGQALQYTTASSPNPCYTASTGAGGSGVVSSGGGYALPAYASGAGTTVGPSNVVTDSTKNNLTIPGSLSVGSGAYTILNYKTTTVATVLALTPSSYTGDFIPVNDMTSCGPPPTGSGSNNTWLYSTGSSWICSIPGGTVTSVAVTAPAYLTVGGSPITTNGTIALTGTSEAANYFLAAPNGSAGAMTPRAIGPADLPAPTTVVSSGAISATTPNQYVICTTTCTVTPLAPAAGSQLCVWQAPGVSTVITMAALGSGNYYGLTSNAAYGTANHAVTSGGAVTDKFCIVGVDATHYTVGAYNGTWSD